jgi:hypothetical protein
MKTTKEDHPASFDDQYQPAAAITTLRLYATANPELSQQ